MADRITCCPAMEKAQTSGSDNEGWEALVLFWSNDGGAAVPYIGSNLPHVQFCPWCGTRVAMPKMEAPRS